MPRSGANLPKRNRIATPEKTKVIRSKPVSSPAGRCSRWTTKLPLIEGLFLGPFLPFAPGNKPFSAACLASSAMPAPFAENIRGFVHSCHRRRKMNFPPMTEIAYPPPPGVDSPFVRLLSKKSPLAGTRLSHRRWPRRAPNNGVSLVGRSGRAWPCRGEICVTCFLTKKASA